MFLQRSHAPHALQTLLCCNKRSSPSLPGKQAGRRADTCCPRAPSRGGSNGQTCVLCIDRPCLAYATPLHYATGQSLHMLIMVEEKVEEMEEKGGRGEGGGEGSAHAASTCASHVGRHAGRLEQRLQFAGLVHADRICRGGHPTCRQASRWHRACALQHTFCLSPRRKLCVQCSQRGAHRRRRQ